MLNIQGGQSGKQIEVETGTLAGRVTLKPNDVGSQGAYRMAAISGTMAAGLAANAPIFSFRNTNTNYALIRRILFSAANVTTAFALGIAQFNAYIARGFTAPDSGGTALAPSTGNKKRTAQATMTAYDHHMSSTAALTAGARTLDTQPFASLVVGVPATAGIQLVNPQTPLFDPAAGDWPFIIAANEGFVIQATVPATGTWAFSVAVDWEEITAVLPGLAV